MKIKYEFHPVGQGLFCSGKLDDDFCWVYDCGSFNNGLLEEATHKFYVANGRIDLLAISHFHMDHINGIALLNRCEINTILMPYLSPEARACVLLHLNGATINDADFVDFLELLHSPAKYFSEKLGVRRFIYVHPSGPSISSEHGISFYDDGNLTSRNDANDFWKQSVPNVAIRDLTDGYLTYQDYRFIPYYDARRLEQNTIETSRHKMYKQLADFFNKEYSDEGAQNIVAALKKKRKKTYYNIEQYSMCLLGTPWRDGIDANKVNVRFECTMCQHVETKDCDLNKSGVLYTGDAKLKSLRQRERFNSYYGDYLHNLLAFQVMHHGARSCCGDGIAEIVNPSYSIFSAKPDFIYGHPHKEVIDEFIDHRPVFVNKTGFYIKIER